LKSGEFREMTHITGQIGTPGRKDLDTIRNTVLDMTEIIERDRHHEIGLIDIGVKGKGRRMKEKDEAIDEVQTNQ
jgi:hypothetical protein